MRLLSGDEGLALTVYALGAFSRARAVINAAASSMRADVPARVAGLLEVPGLRGSGGGALSGSELSHMGTTDARPESEKEC